MQKPTSNGYALNTAQDAYGELRESSDCLNDVTQLRERLAEDGYLFLRGFFAQSRVQAACRAVVERLVELGLLQPHYREARPSREFHQYHIEPALDRLPAVRALVQGEPMLHLYTRLLQGEVRPLDLVWTRVVGYGKAEMPHCDIVYMGRGTPHVYTSWIPLVDVPREQGPIMVLENSHRQTALAQSYWNLDADRAGILSRNLRFKHGRFVRGGRYSKHPVRVQQEFGSRWLSADFHAGDVLILSSQVMHCTLDNLSEHLRLSCDSRYQLASEPVDERWVGASPMAHANQESGFLDHLMDVYVRMRSWLEQK